MKGLVTADSSCQNKLGPKMQLKGFLSLEVYLIPGINCLPVVGLLTCRGE